MLTDIGSPDLYVQTNELPEVTSGTLFSSNSSAPDENGLVSYEIFGNPGSKKRKKQFAYIDLGDIFLHPMAYDAMIMLAKPIKNILEGDGYYYLTRDGKFVRVENQMDAPSGVDCGQGCHWLKRNFKKIDFKKETMSVVRTDRINFLNSLTEDEMFISKWLVMPAYYRDVDINTNKKNDINMMYQNILSQAKTVKSMKLMFSDSEDVTDSHRKIQAKINEMYQYFLTFMGGTKAFIQKHVLGKAPDYSSRMVISTAKINSNNPDAMQTDYAHSAVPLSMVLEDFAPFIEYGFKNFVRNQVNGSDYIYAKTNNGEVKRIPLASHWEQVLLHDNIHDLIKTYSDSKEHRLDYFCLEAEDGSKVPLGYITSRGSVTSTDSDEFNNQSNIVRPITLCEMFYIIAMDTVKDKQIMITRFPIEDYQNVYPSMMNIIPYEKTKVAVIQGVEYPRFPDITMDDIKNKKESFICENFNDTLQLFPTYLKALGADFDGDTVTVQGIFSKRDPMEYINSPMNIINIAGSTMRAVSDINSQMIFALTKTAEDN